MNTTETAARAAVTPRRTRRPRTPDADPELVRVAAAAIAGFWSELNAHSGEPIPDDTDEQLAAHVVAALNNKKAPTK